MGTRAHARQSERIREATIIKLLKRNRIRRFDAANVLDVLRKPPLHVAAGTAEAACAHIAGLIERIRLVDRQLKQAHRQLDALTASLVSKAEAEPGQTKKHDVEILISLPGVGTIVLATLLAEAWDALQRRDYAALRSLTGVAPSPGSPARAALSCEGRPATTGSPTPCTIWARVAVQHDARSRAKYVALRGRGHSHGRALRSVADRLLNVACAMLKNRTLFNPLMAAQKHPC